MKKRLFATLLACAMTVSLVACGGSSSSSEKKEDTSDSKKQEASTEKEVTDITKMSDDEIKEAMKKEPAWGTTITAEYDGGDCTSGPSMAKALGYYDNWGLDVQIAAGTEITEALGTGKAQFGVHHIAHMFRSQTEWTSYLQEVRRQDANHYMYLPIQELNQQKTWKAQLLAWIARSVDLHTT